MKSLSRKRYDLKTKREIATILAKHHTKIDGHKALVEAGITRPDGQPLKYKDVTNLSHRNKRMFAKVGVHFYGRNKRYVNTSKKTYAVPVEPLPVTPAHTDRDALMLLILDLDIEGSKKIKLIQELSK